MNVTATPTANSTILLEIELPPDSLERSMEEATRRLARRTKVAGFRPGKAPRFMLERVRGTLEREFASFLEKRAPHERRRPVKVVGEIVATSLIGPIIQTFGRRLAGQLGNLEDQELKKAFEGFRHHPAASPPAETKPGSNPPGSLPGR